MESEDSETDSEFQKPEYCCCSKCYVPNGRHCVCLIPFWKRKADIHRTGCFGCKCKGCHPLEIARVKAIKKYSIQNFVNSIQ